MKCKVLLNIYCTSFKLQPNNIQEFGYKENIHIKGTPHGTMNVNGDVELISTQKVEVWAQDIKGIIYYLDKNMNVYQTEDIVSNKHNPKIIAKYIKTGDLYNIPEFNI